VESTGSCPRVSFGTTSSGAVGQAGGVLLNETIAAAVMPLIEIPQCCSSEIPHFVAWSG
jgi:hypothetical protein